MVFFGNRCDRLFSFQDYLIYVLDLYTWKVLITVPFFCMPVSGWVSPTNLYDFTPEHISGLLLTTKLDKAHSYRQALLEAIKLSLATGVVYPQNIIDMLEEADVAGGIKVILFE